MQATESRASPTAVLAHPYGRHEIRSLAVVSSFVPRECGVATFAASLRAALSAAIGRRARVSVVALNDVPGGYAYPAEVEFEVRQNVLHDYRLAAEYLNLNRVDAVCLQHEYGLFGGDDGSYVLKLVGGLRAPVITVLHTIRREPSKGQREVLIDLAARSDRMVVMTQLGKKLLREVYGIDEHRIEVVPHGIPDTPFVDPSYYKDQFGLEGKRVILTFGLLSPNKGIEHAISALPAVARRFPDVTYVVLGATHPNLKKVHGESYRLSLEQLARERGVDRHVVFHNRFVDLSELCEFLGAADLYLTPYLNEEQVVSGTLAYAIGFGKPVVSTPYWHAVEVLSDGRGRLVPFADSEALAAQIVDLLGNDRERNAIRKRAYVYSRGSVWTEVARRYLEVFRTVMHERQSRPPAIAVRREPRLPDTKLPEINLRHLETMTDGTGMLQHAIFAVPDRNHGYCTDDNARALIVAMLARRHVVEERRMDQLASRYLAFVIHSFDRSSRAFRNFMGYDRSWLKEPGSPDSQGRALWALGVAATLGKESERRAATELLHVALPAAQELTDLRAIAFACLGLEAFVQRFGGESIAKRLRQLLADRLTLAFRERAGDDRWPWPEQTVTYANARLPHALLAAGRGLDRPDMIELGLRSLSWLAEISTIDGRFVPVGNDGWFSRGGEKARFDQQPIEAETMVAACAEAFRATKDNRWLKEATRCFQWFLGRNDLGAVLYDDSTGGCRDGLGPTGPNENQGAESTLAWLHALSQMHQLQAGRALEAGMSVPPVERASGPS